MRTPFRFTRVFHESTHARVVAIALACSLATATFGCDRNEGSVDPPNLGQRYEQQSEAGHFVVRVQPREGEAPLRSLHEWTVQITDRKGGVVRPSRLTLTAGMEQHGHGMETRPRVTEVLPDGRYVVGGMKFNMSGEWQVQVEVADGATSDVARFDVLIQP